MWWGTLCHEYAHNFVQYGDLYGPQGCTGYWDLLGDNSPPGRMSEVCAEFKRRVGWLEYAQVIEGPSFAETTITLNPYTTSGEAIKVVPDPANTPHEYFVLEFRKSTGTETWRPDGALSEAGLLVTHINDRIGIPRTWLNREAPLYDPEFADGRHFGGTDWTGHKELDGVLYPQPSRTAFTPHSVPSSNLYGHRRSGLSITDIAVSGDTLTCKLRIDPVAHEVGWSVGAGDRALAGHFTADAAEQGAEIFIRNDDNAALLVHRQAQWLVGRHHADWIGGWNLGNNDRELVGDFDGDGRDEIYIRSNNWAGVLEWRTSRFASVTVQHDWIDGWNLGTDNWEHVGDFDGDGIDEIYIRSPRWAGVLELSGGALRLRNIQHDRIDDWRLGADNQEFVGRFTTPDRDEIAIRSPEWIGLLQYDDDADELRLASIQHDWVDGWNMGPADRHVVGDFDGDGLDEIYIRSAGWAGLLKWQSGRFRVVWMTAGPIPHDDGNPDHAQPLTGDDRSYPGRFFTDRDGIIHRDASGLSLLRYDGTALVKDRRLSSSLGGRWNLGADDQFVLGDFHRTGTDPVDTGKHYIIDGVTDIFIHNGWGTGMVGVNPLPDRYQFNLTWIQASHLLRET